MNRREQIIRYLDGQMSEEEKLHFDELMTLDNGLKKETDRVKNMLLLTKSNALPEANESYFVNILPEFYARRAKKKKFHFAKLAYSLSTAAAVMVLLFILFKPGSSADYSNLSELSSSFTENEINETIDQLAGGYSLSELAGSAPAKTDSIVSSMLADELELTHPEEGDAAERYLDAEELLSSIDESEANELYSQLINEDIIKGEKQ